MGGAARRVLAVAVAAAVAAAMCAGVATAAVYEVGDKTGWTVMGNPDYVAWASSKKFKLGDTIVFVYNKQFHNVLAVSKADYKNCDATKPTGTWSTGNDSVVLNTTGHHYFLCGYPGHCAAGQKVDVRVASSAAPSVAPATAPAPASGSSPAAAAAPTPRPNAAAPKAAGRPAAVVALAAAALAVGAAVLA